MQAVTAVFSYIIDMGAAVMMPIIFTILGMIMGSKFTDALRAGMTFGVGFIGLNAIVGLLSGCITPVANKLVENLNFPLTSVDIGWAAGSAIAWSTEVVPFVFVIVLVTNIVMIAFNWTKTMDVDIWNYWHVLFTASAIVSVCGGTALAWAFALGQAALMMAIIFIVADWTQADCAEMFGLEGISLPHIQAMCQSIYAYPLNKLLDSIPGVKDIELTADTLTEKLGFLGEPMMLGFIIGAILSALAEFSTPGVNPLTAIQQMLIVGMNVGAVLVLIPRMVSLLMEGLMPLSEQTQIFLEKRFPGRELYIGLDAAVATGHPFVVTTALICIPIILVLAVVLPWNTVLPLADLSALVFFVIPAVLASKGNFFRAIIIGVVTCIILLTFSTYAAPVMTGLASSTGLAVPEGAAQITNLAQGSQWITWFPFMLAKMVCL